MPAEPAMIGRVTCCQNVRGGASQKLTVALDQEKVLKKGDSITLRVSGRKPFPVKVTWPMQDGRIVNEAVDQVSFIIPVGQLDFPIDTEVWSIA